jgi:HSP20 family protein
MARDSELQQREETAPRDASDSSGKRVDASEQKKSSTERTRTANTSSAQTDREQAMRTDREDGRSAGIARRQSTPAVFGPAGSITPFAMMRRMAEDMDRLFENFGFGRSGLGLSPLLGADLDRDLWRQASTLQQSAWTPQVEAFRRGDQLVVRADLPGLNKDDVRVELEDGVLTISGERREEHEDSRDDYYRSERTYGQFYRTIPLPEGVTGEQCDASFKDGVLEVTLPVPKTPERKAKRVQIR